MGVILRHFLCLTSPEMGPVVKASGTERHQWRRENSGHSPLSPIKSSLIRNAENPDCSATREHFLKASAHVQLNRLNRFSVRRDEGTEDGRRTEEASNGPFESSDPILVKRTPTRLAVGESRWKMLCRVRRLSDSRQVVLAIVNSTTESR